MHNYGIKQQSKMNITIIASYNLAFQHLKKSFEQVKMDIQNYASVTKQQIKMVKTGQFTTKCKGDIVIALKRQISL